MLSCSAAPIMPGAIAPMRPAFVAFILIDGEFDPQLETKFETST